MLRNLCLLLVLVTMACGGSDAPSEGKKACADLEAKLKECQLTTIGVCNADEPCAVRRAPCAVPSWQRAFSLEKRSRAVVTLPAAPCAAARLLTTSSARMASSSCIRRACVTDSSSAWMALMRLTAGPRTLALLEVG